MKIPNKFREAYNQERDAVIKELQDRWLDGMTYAQYSQCISHTFIKGQKLKLMQYKAMKYTYAEHEARIALDEKHKEILHYLAQEQPAIKDNWNLSYHLCRYALIAMNDERKKLEELHYKLRTNRAAIIESQLIDPILTDPNVGVEKFDGFEYHSEHLQNLIAERENLNEKLAASRGLMRDAMAMIYPAFSFVQENFPEFADLIEWAQKQNEKTESQQALVNDFTCYCKGCQKNKKPLLVPLSEKLENQPSMVELGSLGVTPAAMTWQYLKGEK